MKLTQNQYQSSWSLKSKSFSYNKNDRIKKDLEDFKLEIIKIKVRLSSLYRFLQTVNSELEAKGLNYDEDFSMLKSDNETTKMNFQLMQRRMNDLP